MFILDTNVISELRRAGKAHPSVVQWADARPVTQFFLSVVTILELDLGVHRVMRKDPAQGKVLRHWIDTQILTRFDGRILVIDTAVARQCARLHDPDPRSERDALIAATALVHGMTVVTRNVADFDISGLRVFNPWT
jgi:predicted nucleic acid-binding protein